MNLRRYKVTGEKDGVPCGASYKTLGPAKSFADTLTNSEVYDSVSGAYLYGTSKFVTNLLKAKQ
jgi:hypothetical protein